MGASPLANAHNLARRRVVVAATLVAGASATAWGLHIEPGNALFYPVTFAMAAIWIGGSMASGLLRAPVHRVGATTTSRRVQVTQAAVVGLLLLAVFLLGALLVSRVPSWREPVVELLAHATLGSFTVVLLITIVNGVAEEVFYRGALFAALPRRLAMPVTTAVYAAVTALTGIVLLVFAAVILGAVTARQRWMTGGLLAPLVTHLVWSVGMLIFLPKVLT